MAGIRPSGKSRERRSIVRSREVVLLLAVVTALTMGSDTALAQGSGATAQIEDAQGNVVGTAGFTEGAGGLVVSVEARGLAPGEHGIHLHETGACDPPAFESAGGHINPAEAQHGLSNPQGPHAGDLPGISGADDGTAVYEATTDRVTLSGGDASLLDADGSAIVIHADADDQATDPTGNSGDRVACGVVTATSMPETGGVNVLLLSAAVAGGASIVGIGMLLSRRSLRG